MRYYPIHMHLHCSHEPTASIGSHMSHCKELGIAYMWTTEHDTRMGKKKRDIPVFSFSEKELFTTLANGAKAGFKEEENGGRYAFEETKSEISLRIVASENEKETLLFYSQGKAHSDPLFSRLNVEMNADIERKAGGQVCVGFNATDIKCGGYAVCISGGNEVKRLPIVKGNVSGEWILSCEQKYNFARVEIYNEENILIAFSNPIYLIDEKTEIKER